MSNKFDGSDYVNVNSWLWRKGKSLRDKWKRQYFVLIDGEIHYYPTERADPKCPKGTMYICTHSGKPFPVVAVITSASLRQFQHFASSCLTAAVLIGCGNH
jgi:hypothetical protein